MSGETDGPTLGQVYWCASGMRPEAYADIPARSRKQIEEGAAAVGAHAIARLRQGEPRPRVDWARASEAVADRERERDEAREQLAVAMTENVRLRKDLADAEAEIGRWPRCPGGCRCRVGTNDADALECGCDGPCTTGWDAPRAAPELAAAKPRWTERFGPVVACDHGEIEEAYTAARGRIAEAEGERDRLAAQLGRLQAEHATLCAMASHNAGTYAQTHARRELLDRALFIAAQEIGRETATTPGAVREQWLAEARQQADEAREDAEFLTDAASLDTDLRGDR